MRIRTLILTIAIAFALFNISIADTYVRGYYKSNGTYVQPHYRSSPNSTKSDNFSTRGNVNPYTGRMGTKSDDGGNNYNYFNNYNRTKTNCRSLLC